MFRLIIAIVTIPLFLMASAAYASPEGIWLRANQETKIAIEKCSDAYCGTVVWMIAEKRDALDKNNPHPDLQKRPIIGLKIFEDMKPSGENTYEGTLYNAEDGKTYSGTLTIVDEKTLKLRGCVIWPLCKTDTWSRTTLAVNTN